MTTKDYLDTIGNRHTRPTATKITRYANLYCTKHNIEVQKIETVNNQSYTKFPKEILKLIIDKIESNSLDLHALYMESRLAKPKKEKTKNEPPCVLSQFYALRTSKLYRLELEYEKQTYFWSRNSLAWYFNKNFIDLSIEEINSQLEKLKHDHEQNIQKYPESFKQFLSMVESLKEAIKTQGRSCSMMIDEDIERTHAMR